MWFLTKQKLNLHKETYCYYSKFIFHCTLNIEPNNELSNTNGFTIFVKDCSTILKGKRGSISKTTPKGPKNQNFGGKHSPK